LGTEARLFRPDIETLPEDWDEVARFPIVQMMAERTDARLDPALSPLSISDTPAMLDLVAATEPGPFGLRTAILGRYFGVWRKGRLMAIAGERMRLPGHVELSAICVRPEARGKGYAAALTAHQMRLACEDGETPFLHVRPDNAAAIGLYQRLGFATRRELMILRRRPR
jgi:ribosomal protein S18 acetylase RimI-like enzyme